MMRNVLRFALPMLVLFFLGIGLNFQPMEVQAQASFGSNWLASYFPNTALSGNPSITQIESQINFLFSTGKPPATSFLPTFPSDNFSIRFQSLVNFPTSGIYRFTALADDGVRVKIDGTTIIDNFTQTGTSTARTADVNVTAGNRDIVVEYVEFTGNAVIQFSWTPVAVGTVGPSPTATNTGLPPIPAGALTATVIRAAVLNVRDAPSLGGNVVNRILRGQTYQVVGRNDDATWFVLQLNGQQGWAWGYYLFINGNEFNAPVVAATTLYGIPPGFNDTGVLAQSEATIRLRLEPNVLSPQIGRVTWGAFMPVSGRTAGGDWYQVLWKGTIGWVASAWVEIRQGDYNNIPVIR
jgi:uncharacterized protein YraI